MSELTPEEMRNRFADSLHKGHHFRSLDLWDEQARRIALLEQQAKLDQDANGQLEARIVKLDRVIEHYQIRFNNITEAWRKGDNEKILDSVRKHITAKDCEIADRLLASPPTDARITTDEVSKRVSDAMLDYSAWDKSTGKAVLDFLESQGRHIAELEQALERTEAHWRKELEDYKQSAPPNDDSRTVISQCRTALSVAQGSLRGVLDIFPQVDTAQHTLKHVDRAIEAIDNLRATPEPYTVYGRAYVLLDSLVTHPFADDCQECAIGQSNAFKEACALIDLVNSGRAPETEGSKP